MMEVRTVGTIICVGNVEIIALHFILSGRRKRILRQGFSSNPSSQANDVVLFQAFIFPGNDAIIGSKYPVSSSVLKTDVLLLTKSLPESVEKGQCAATAKTRSRHRLDYYIAMMRH
jgi:hypothetical protein